MKSSEAKKLSPEELILLRDLMRRWVLGRYPYFGGSSEESDAYTTYESIENDASVGKTGHGLSDNELETHIKKWGESKL